MKYSTNANGDMTRVGLTAGAAGRDPAGSIHSRRSVEPRPFRYAKSFVRGTALLGSLIMIASGCSYESLYRRTEPGTFEIKKLPPMKAVRSETDGDYFDESNDLFRPLFQYIKEEDISMTVPVEMRRRPGRMYFLLGSSEAAREAKPNGVVEVLELPARTVASHGARGAYSLENFEQAAERLEDWLERQMEYSANGDPYGVYWDGPFRLPFFKRFEVHIPLRMNRTEDGG